MKTKLIVAALAVFSLGGCVAVPVYDSGPAQGYGYYAPPAASFSFRYFDRGGGYRHGHRHGRSHRY